MMKLLFFVTCLFLFNLSVFSEQTDTLNEVQKIQKLQHYRSERDIVYKNRRNNKRKQNKRRNKEYRNKNIRNKLSKKSRNPKMQYRQRIAFKGENCQFVDFGLVGSE